jgi:hypothetical protein
MYHYQADVHLSSLMPATFAGNVIPLRFEVFTAMTMNNAVIWDILELVSLVDMVKGGFTPDLSPSSIRDCTGSSLPDYSVCLFVISLCWFFRYGTVEHSLRQKDDRVR